MSALKIDFGKDPLFTGGRGNWARCTTEDGTVRSIPSVRSKKWAIGQLGGPHLGGGGAIYRLIIKLCDAGYEGRQFEAHDQRILCLRGTISRQAVPVDYGGEKQPSTKTKEANNA